MVLTPNKLVFPAKLYYGASGMSLAGWRSWRYDKVFPQDFRAVINCSPFDLSKAELEQLIEALELSLKKVPPADFYGIYRHDEGNILIGLKKSRPFIFNLGYTYSNKDIKIYLESIL